MTSRSTTRQGVGGSNSAKKRAIRSVIGRILWPMLSIGGSFGELVEGIASFFWAPRWSRRIEDRLTRMPGSRQQGLIPNFREQGPVETVEAGAQTCSVSAELTQFDPVARTDIGRQQERAGHEIGTVAGRPIKAERRNPGIGRLAVEADHPRREAPFRHAGIRQISVNAVIDMEHVAA